MYIKPTHAVLPVLERSMVVICVPLALRFLIGLPSSSFSTRLASERVRLSSPSLSWSSQPVTAICEPCLVIVAGPVSVSRGGDVGI